eukprot:09550_6
MNVLTGLVDGELLTNPLEFRGQSLQEVQPLRKKCVLQIGVSEACRLQVAVNPRYSNWAPQIFLRWLTHEQVPMMEGQICRVKRVRVTGGQIWARHFRFCLAPPRTSRRAWHNSSHAISRAHMILLKLLLLAVLSGKTLS